MKLNNNSFILINISCYLHFAAIKRYVFINIIMVKYFGKYMAYFQLIGVFCRPLFKNVISVGICGNYKGEIFNRHFFN